MEGLDTGLPTRIVFGNDTVDGAGDIAVDLGTKRAFIVTDSGLIDTGHVARLEQALDRSDVEHRRFDGVSENPSTADVDACLATLAQWQPDVWIGFGGGSSIDVAKAANLCRAGGGTVHDYWGKGLAKGHLQPIIAIPTTAGTGSEVQSFTLIAQADSHQKMACGDPQMAPRIAILDPTLCTTLPRIVTICTGLDTLAHAVESGVCKTRTKESSSLSARALALVDQNLAGVIESPRDLEARGNMLLAAAYAGAAIEKSMLGAAHSLSNPLTAHHKIPHGQAVGIMLPEVIRFNAQDPSIVEAYGKLTHAADMCHDDVTWQLATQILVERIEALLVLTGIETSLTSLGVTSDDHHDLAKEAARQWTAKYNPRPLSVDDFRDLLAARH